MEEEAEPFDSLNKVQPQTSLVINENEGEDIPVDSDVGSQLATGSMSALTAEQNEEDLEEDGDRLSPVSDTGWETDLEIEGKQDSMKLELQ